MTSPRSVSSGEMNPIREDASSLGQVRALMIKQAIFQKRQKRTNICQLMTTVIIVILMFLLQQLVDSFVQDEDGSTLPAVLNQPTDVPYFLYTKTGIDGCAAFQGGEPAVVCNYSSPEPCPTQPESVIPAELWYTITDDVSTTDLGQFGAGASGLLGGVENAPIRTYKGMVWPDRGYLQDMCLRDPYYSYPLNFTQWASPAAMQQYIYNNFRDTNKYGGYVFDTLSAATRALSYAVFYNSSLTLGDDVPRFSSLIVQSAARLFTGGQLSVDFKGTRDFPVPERDNSFDLISLIGPQLYIYVFQLTLPMSLYALVYEKEQGLREITRISGLRSAPYWVVNYVFAYALYFLSAMFFWIVAAIFQFRYWTLNSPGAIFLLLFLWGHVMVALVFLLTVFFQRAKTASVGGYLWVFAFGMLSGTVIRTFYDNQDTPRASIVTISLFFPPFTLYRGLIILSRGVTFGEPGLQWKDINQDEVQLGEVFWFMFVQWIVLMPLAAYLEAVWPAGYGVKRHPLFFLRRSFWVRSRDDADATLSLDDVKSQVQGEPEDVDEERQRIRNGEPVDLLIADLHKIYPGRAGAPPKEAVRYPCFGVEAGTCFGLLGSNGAGKSTLINMIAGLFPPTDGTASICGYDISTDPNLARLNLGICQQDDRLWLTLTAVETLQFYGRLRGLGGAALKAAVNKALEDVALGDPATRKKLVGEFSGGMKRRLSVACALIGSPRVIILDEPSTGLDPASKARLWQVILESKRTSALILTTHSMEEAEALCDRLGIFLDGQLRCIGTCADLKTRFGHGLKLSLTAEPGRDDDATAFVRQVCPPDTNLLSALAGNYNYEITKSRADLAALFHEFTRNAQAMGVRDWGISDTTLEEVFFAVLRRFGDPDALAGLQIGRDGKDMHVGRVSTSYASYASSIDEGTGDAKDLEVVRAVTSSSSSSSPSPSSSSSSSS